MKARLYYEVHITVEPKPLTTYEEFVDNLPSMWRASKFEHDDVDHIQGKWFLSGRFINEFAPSTTPKLFSPLFAARPTPSCVPKSNSPFSTQNPATTKVFFS